ncbi:hypothetical protein PsorP6_009047 [Peronosclerospora sorghi]|uniref:Uncharacterized protein n=1 Tax=Peronosclerospora sorghi TaxID=230839 RepID=A0ACC0W1I3_9STRA|nr:hypothetical protein PsorP6_009047 [Peronosclerospora sorghi]
MEGDMSELHLEEEELTQPIEELNGQVRNKEEERRKASTLNRREFMMKDAVCSDFWDTIKNYGALGDNYAKWMLKSQLN